MWFVYILKCSDGSYYTGITNDLEKRLATHESGKGSKYVRAKLPFTLVHTEEFATKSEAARREFEVKKLTRTQKQTLIENNVMTGRDLSLPITKTLP